jgi:hypothetical protein
LGCRINPAFRSLGRCHEATGVKLVGYFFIPEVIQAIFWNDSLVAGQYKNKPG